jgi:hypothetical protein
MEDRVVTPAKPARSVDGAQQALDQRPCQCARRQLTPVGARRVNCVEPFSYFALVEAKPKKSTKASDNVL